MSSDLFGNILLDGRRIGGCYFPAPPAAGQPLRVEEARYRITSVGWVVPPLRRGRGLAEVDIEVSPEAG